MIVDEMQRLHDTENLRQLLTHYAELGKADRQVWQDRLTALDVVVGRELTCLYGELLAYGWLEQNTGVTPVLQPGRFACCYRVTPAGLRALKQIEAEKHDHQTATV